MAIQPLPSLLIQAISASASTRSINGSVDSQRLQSSGSDGLPMEATVLTRQLQTLKAYSDVDMQRVQQARQLVGNQDSFSSEAIAASIMRVLENKV